jgi:hypothetical protein
MNNGKDENWSTRREENGTVEGTGYAYGERTLTAASHFTGHQSVRTTRTVCERSIRRTDTITGGILRSQIETNRNLTALLEAVLEQMKVQTLELETLLEEHQRRIDTNP